MTYRFRLTVHHSRPGLFRFDEEARSFFVGDGIELTVATRDAKSLSEATRYHMEARGFSTEEAARSAGERLRLRLRILNAMLGLGISIPTKDTTSGGASAEIKKELQDKFGTVILDTIVGLAVFPDDGRHIEFVTAGEAKVYPADPTYLFTALSEIWQIEMRFDDRSRDALEILDHAVKEPSPRSKFLLTYLAVERMVERGMRSADAVAVIKELEDHVRAAGLSPREAESLIGSVARLRERSFSSALTDLGRRIQSDEKFCDKPLTKFLSSCIGIRHKVAHDAIISEDVDLGKMSDALRKFCMSLMWTYNQIPGVTVNVPGSVVFIPEGGLSIQMT